MELYRLYIHIRFSDFTTVSLVTKGYEKISTVIIFYTPTVLLREEHERYVREALATSDLGLPRLLPALPPICPASVAFGP
jgi:hypothetical protein